MDKNVLTEMENIDFVTAIQSLVNRSCIIDFGVIQKVVAKGVVDVAVSVANTENNIVVLTCVLANISSASFTFDIEPNVGDKVIIFYPRTYDDTMFNVPDKEEDRTNVIINKDAVGYSLLGGIAFLFNQYRKNSHKNYINFNNGKLNIHTDVSNITLDDNGYLSYENTKDEKSKAVFTSGGFQLQDANGCTIVSDSTSVKINGTLEIKKK